MSEFRRAPYYDAKQSYYDTITEGMSDKAKRGFANALAHHMMPLYRTAEGWFMTRHDLIKDRLPKGLPVTDFIDNEGVWHYRVEYKE